MNGGLLKSASTLALIAVASISLGTVSAKAADLGGNCCADLEERVAELEATTARKGNRKVKLTVSGQVNEAVLFWDDGSERNVYVVSNNSGRTRFRFVGDAKINADWSAGYLLEIGARYANSANRSQLSVAAGGNAANIDIRHSAWYLDSKTFGRVWVGKTSTATDGITEINLSNAVNAGPDVAAAWSGGGFRLRASGRAGQNGLSGINRNTGLAGTGTALAYNLIAGGQISANANVGEGDRNAVIKYVSPTFFGFSAQAAYGEDKVADVALRWAGEFGSVRAAAGIGYRKFNDNGNGADGTGGCANTSATGANLAAANGTVPINQNQSSVKCEQLGLSASAMHVPTGLYVAGSYGEARDGNKQALFAYNGANAALNTSAVRSRDFSWYIQGGIEQNWLGIGKTTLYGEYYKGKFGSTVSANTVAFLDATDPLNSFAAGNARISSYDLEVWGLGVNQAVDAAAMDLYISYRRYKNDLTLMQQSTAATVTQKSNALQDYQAVMVGGIIRF